MTLAAVGISLGDPGGVGPEIVLKALSERASLPEARYIVFGARSILDRSGGCSWPSTGTRHLGGRRTSVPSRPVLPGCGRLPWRFHKRKGFRRKRRSFVPLFQSGRRDGQIRPSPCGRHRADLQNVLAPRRPELPGPYRIPGESFPRSDHDLLVGKVTGRPPQPPSAFAGGHRARQEGDASRLLPKPPSGPGQDELRSSGAFSRRAEPSCRRRWIF